jgi:chaperone required for assembly of F1-ATPase
VTRSAPELRRPYSVVAVARSERGAFRIMLDDKPLRSPAGTILEAPVEPLAAAIAAEWDAQGPKLVLDLAPLTRLLGTALDRMPSQRARVVDDLTAYAETELVCHRADSPPELVRRQQATWDPLLTWFRQRHDASLVVVSGVLPQAQPLASLSAVRLALASLDDLALTGASLAIGAAGSLVIGLALLDGRLDVDGAFFAAELDASFQIERWGEDAEARTRRQRIRDDLALAGRWHTLLRAQR